MAEFNNMDSSIGAVVIGRNEGERLKTCLESIGKHLKNIVYVDSGSTDNSMSIAHEMGVHVVELDMLNKFTAARARNVGYNELLRLNPDLEYVQFVDGDCEVVPEWISHAFSFLEEHSDVAIVSGRRRERFPDKTIYNKICDIEWETPIGEVKACGGDAMIRSEAFNMVDGFRDDLIAGEESELCVRLRQRGWKIWRIDMEMTLHDANITRFNQWWMRTIRGGYAYAEGMYLHGKKPERHRVRDSQRILFWGMVLPLTIMSLALFNPWWVLLILAYPIQIIRIALHGTRSIRDNWIYATFLVLGKFPGMLGQAKFLFHLLSGRRGVLIEYK